MTLNLLTQVRREFRQPLSIAYVDLKSAFDSVDRSALWRLLLSLGLPQKIVDLMKDLYTNTVSAVRSDGLLSEWFQVNSEVRQGCRIAPDLFLTPMDYIMNKTVHRGFTGATLGDEVFTDLDFADDVAILAEMLEIIILSLEILSEEARPFGLEVNWSKTKIQSIDAPRTCPSTIEVAGNQVEVVQSFSYLGCLTDNSGGSEPEVIRRIAISRDCFNSLDRFIWRSSIRLQTKVRLYRVYILPVLLYGAEAWTLTSSLNQKLDAFHQWCLRRLLRAPYTLHMTNAEVFMLTDEGPISVKIRASRLRLFGHVARSKPEEDHARALRATIFGPPKYWKRPVGRPRTTWSRTIEADLATQNLGLFTALRRAQDRTIWRRIVETATLQRGMP
jgi:hypothetical protein